MAENEINIDNNKQLKKNDLMNMMGNDNPEDFQNGRSKTIMQKNMENIKFLQNYSRINENEIDDYIPSNKLKRCNSVDIYKKRIREKKLKNMQNKNEHENFDNTRNLNTNDNNIIEKNGKKIKRVSFVSPTLVTFINVESYKKYNQENYSDEPFERVINNKINIKKSINMKFNKNNDINNDMNNDMNNNINNKNNDINNNSNINMNNNSDIKIEKKENQIEKENVVCSCLIA